MKKFSKEQLDKIINNSFKAGTQNNLYYLSEETFRQMKKDKRFVQTYKVRTDIANEMLNLIDKSVWHNKNAKVLQLAGMSDDFFSLMFSRFYFGLASEIPDRYERAQYILDNNIYILCLDLVNQLYTQTECYCEPVSDSNIFKFGTYKIENNRLIEVSCNNVLGNISLYQMMLSLLDGGLKVEDMKFDAVVGNPPYNDDIYIDFVNLGFDLLKDNGAEVMITPAKWQAKSGQKNENFRKNIVPHMKKIVMYRDTHDVFDIDDNAGMSYYIINKENHYKNWNVKGVCTKNSVFNFDWEIHNEDTLTLYSNKVISIIEKCKTEKMITQTLNFKRCIYVGERERGKPTKTHDTDVDVMQGNKHVGFMPISQLKTTANIDKYKVTCAIMIGGAVMFNNDLKILGSASYTHVDPNQVLKGSFPCIRYFDTELECKSFESFMMSKLMSFLFFLGICGATMTNNFFMYIPDQDKFDHIFTDEELYKKYNLTDEEINIIESVIKERKSK